MLSASDASRLVRWYVGRLSGQGAALIDDLLGGARWTDRADALAILNLSLIDGLRAYAGSGSSLEPYKGRTRGQVVAALRRRWGIDRYPDRTSPDFGGPKISHSTLRNWEHSAFESEAFRSALERSAISRVSAKAGGDEAWLKEPPSAFPPDSATLDAIMVIARNAGLGTDRATAIQIVRQVVTLRIRNYLVIEPRHLIHHREVVECSWFRKDVQFIEPVRGMLSGQGAIGAGAERGLMLRVSNAVTLLEFFLCLLNPSAFGQALQDTAQTRASFRMFLQRGGPQSLFIARPSSLASTTSSSVHHDIDPSSPAGQAINMAYEIRAAPKDQRAPLVREYVRLRREIQPHLGSYSAEYARTVVQADQSVSHDSMDGMDQDGFREVDGLRTAAGQGGPLSSYRTLTWRDKGVFKSKQGSLADAIRITDRGIDDLLALEPRSRGDGHAFLESLHQHLLSNAGTAAKIVEQLLVEVPRRRSLRRSVWVYARWARASISYAARAHSALDQLGRPGDGLPERRHQDGYIASRDWWIQTRIMYLRALLGAQTLLDSVGERDEDGAVNRAIMRTLYREIAGDLRLRPPRIYTFTQLAVWLAFVDGMSLPYVGQPSIGLSTVPFLTLSENEAPPGVTYVAIDEERVVRAKFWFERADGWDRGPITRVRAGTAVADYLSMKTDNISEIWLRDDD